MDTNKSIQLKLKEIIKTNELLQQDLANLLGVKENVISYFVTGKRRPNLDQLIIISKTYNVSLDDLCGLSPTSTKVIPIENPKNEILKTIEFKEIVDICRKLQRLDKNAHELLNAYKKHEKKSEKTQKLINNVKNIQKTYASNEIKLYDLIKKVFNSTITLTNKEIAETKNACLYYINK